MDSFGPKNYSAGIKRILPEGLKVQKEGIDLICSIIYEINNNFVKVCLQTTGRQNITPKVIESAIKNMIPQKFRKLALANGRSVVLNYLAGTVQYSEPKPLPAGEILTKNMVRKGLEMLVGTAHEDLQLSTRCVAMPAITVQLATYLADKAVATVEGGRPMSVENMGLMFRNILGEDVFTHAQGHAERNLEWYRTNRLELNLRLVATEEDDVEDGTIIFTPGVQKLAKEFTANLSKDTLKKVEIILKDVMYKIADDAIQRVKTNSDRPMLSDNDAIRAVQSLFPTAMYAGAVAHANAKLMFYSWGILKYKPPARPEEVEELEEPMEVDEDFLEQQIIPDFKRGVRRLVDDWPIKFDRGCLQAINDTLLCMCRGIVDTCVAIADRENRIILTAQDPVSAISFIYPELMLNHAVARVRRVQQELNLSIEPVAPDFGQRFVPGENVQGEVNRDIENAETGQIRAEDRSSSRSEPNVGQYKKLSVSEYEQNGIRSKSHTESMNIENREIPSVSDYGRNGNRSKEYSSSQTENIGTKSVSKNGTNGNRNKEYSSSQTENIASKESKTPSVTKNEINRSKEYSSSQTENVGTEETKTPSVSKNEMNGNRSKEYSTSQTKDIDTEESKTPSVSKNEINENRSKEYSTNQTENIATEESKPASASENERNGNEGEEYSTSQTENMDTEESKTASVSKNEINGSKSKEYSTSQIENMDTEESKTPSVSETGINVNNSKTRQAQNINTEDMKMSSVSENKINGNKSKEYSTSQTKNMNTKENEPPKFKNTELVLKIRKRIYWLDVRPWEQAAKDLERLSF